MYTELRAAAHMLDEADATRPFDRERFRTFIEGLGFTVTSYQLDYMEKLHNRQLIAHFRQSKIYALYPHPLADARPVDIRNRLAHRR